MNGGGSGVSAEPFAGWNRHPPMRTSPQSDVPRRRSLRDLFAQAEVVLVGGAEVPEVPITSLCDDSRAVNSGACFVAVRGAKVDGHEFIDAAAKAGAAAIVVERDGPIRSGLVCVRVADTREALAKLAAAYHGLRGGAGPAMRLIGITGTNGKTTVSWLLRSILQAGGEKSALIGTVEYDLVSRRLDAPLTTPGSLQVCRDLAIAREAGATSGVLEVSSHALDQRRCDGLTFAAGVFTNLTGDHLDYHRTTEAYGAAKARLFDLLGMRGAAVVNVDDAYGRVLADRMQGRATTFGVDACGADVTARVVRMDHRGTQLFLRGRSSQLQVESALTGGFNVSNLLAAAATAEAIGIAPDTIREGIERLRGVPGRLQRVETEGSAFSVYVDFAHTDAALSNVLDTLRPLTRGRLICVFGCGGDRDRTKRPRMGAAVGKAADVAFVTSDNPRSEDPQAIIGAILPGFPRNGRCRVSVEVDRRKAIEAAIGEARPDDTVLIAGKGHEKYQEVRGVETPFDDVQVARECLQAAPVSRFGEAVA